MVVDQLKPKQLGIFICIYDIIFNACIKFSLKKRKGIWKIIKGCPGLWTDWYNLTEYNLEKYKIFNGELISLTDGIDLGSNCLSRDTSKNDYYFLFNLQGMFFKFSFI